MLLLSELDIPVESAEYLASFEEIGWFLNELVERKKKRNYQELLNMAEAFKMGSIGATGGKNSTVYTRWVRSIQSKIEGQKEETVFDRIRKIKPKTFFDKVRGMV